MKRPRGYYLHYRDLKDVNRKKTGIDLKVQDQIKALNDLGCECDFVFCSQPETTLAMVRSCLPFMSDGIAWPSSRELKDADFLYIRIPRFISKEMLAFLHEFKTANPESLVILEVPTYPYDAIMKNWKLFCALLKDRAHRHQLFHYVDCISDLSGAEKIFDIATVQIYNGIDLERIKMREIGERSPNTFNIMCSSFYRDYHGIDRLIKGLSDYYRTERDVSVNLYLAGGGDELPRLKSMTKSLGLGDHVFFPGVLDEEELNILYRDCSLAVGVLGLHRMGAEVTSALKTREYLAKGIPFIYSAGVDVLEKEKLDVCLNLPSDDSPINIAEVIDFYKKAFSASSETEIAMMIRNYAERNITMRKAMEKVAELILTSRS